MAESTGLLNLHTGNRITSSNLVLSAQCNQQADAAPFWCGIFVSGRAGLKTIFDSEESTEDALTQSGFNPENAQGCLRVVGRSVNVIGALPKIY